jgi:hypothetical protein
VDCHHSHSGIYGQITSRKKIQLISINVVLISCGAEGLGRPQGTPSKALENFGYKASRSGPNMNYFEFSVIILTVKYPKNTLKTGPTGIFFGG